MTFGHKNPEYTIDGKLGDRKGIMGERGVTAGFKAAKKQGCKIVGKVRFYNNKQRLSTRIESLYFT